MHGATLHKNLENQINFLLRKEGLDWKGSIAVPVSGGPSLAAPRKAMSSAHPWLMVALAVIVCMIASYVLMS